MTEMRDSERKNERKERERNSYLYKLFSIRKEEFHKGKQKIYGEKNGLNKNKAQN
jgi:hypothetical protein